MVGEHSQTSSEDVSGEDPVDLPAGYLEHAEMLASMEIEGGLWAKCRYLDGIVLDEGSIIGDAEFWRDVYELHDRAQVALRFVSSTWDGSAGVPLCPLDAGLSVPPMSIELASDLVNEVGSQVLANVWAPCAVHSDARLAEFEADAEVYLSNRPWRWHSDSWMPAPPEPSDE